MGSLNKDPNPEEFEKWVAKTYPDINNLVAIVDLKVAKEEVAAYVVLCKNEARPILVDIRNIKSVTGEARSHLAGEESAKVTRAVALLISSPLSRIIGKFFLGLNKTSFPSKLFTSEEEAFLWLRGFLK